MKIKKKRPHEELWRVFTDAHVVHVDFSAWDKRITMLVLADHYRDWTLDARSRMPLLNIDFFEASCFKLKIPPPLYLESDQRHCQWRISYAEIVTLNGRLQLALDGGGVQSPGLEMECKTYEIREIDHAMLDRRFPRWDEPDEGLLKVADFVERAWEDER